MEGEIRAQSGEQPWVPAEGTPGRADYEQARAEEIEEKREWIAGMLRQRFGESIPEELIVSLSRELATHYRDAFEQGLQAGVNSERSRQEDELRRLSSFQMHALGGLG